MLVNRELNIVIADDHSLILDGFKNLMESQLPKSKIYTVENKTTLFKLLEENHIDILFQDIKFGRDDAREFILDIFIRTLSSQHSKCIKNSLTK